MPQSCLRGPPADSNLIYILFSCRNQIVSLFASCLIEPDIFGAASADSCRQVLQLLGDAAASASSLGGAPECLGALVEAVAAELEHQNALSKVTHHLCVYVALFL
jgi:hypothetical protein